MKIHPLHPARRSRRSLRDPRSCAAYQPKSSDHFGRLEKAGLVIMPDPVDLLLYAIDAALFSGASFAGVDIYANSITVEKVAVHDLNSPHPLKWVTANKLMYGSGDSGNGVLNAADELSVQAPIFNFL